MARVKLNDAFTSLSGTLGELMFSTRRGKVIVRPKGQAHLPRSPAQLAHQEVVKLAAAYGRLARTDPVLSRAYAAAAHEKALGVYQIAFGDYLQPPEVVEIDVQELCSGAGGAVRIRAADNFGVVQVRVELRSVEGTLIESGAAELDATTGEWLYPVSAALAPGQAVSVEAVAFDRPGHSGRKTVWAVRR